MRRSRVATGILILCVSALLLSCVAAHGVVMIPMDLTQTDHLS